MSTLTKCNFINQMPGVVPYIKCVGDEYFRKGFFRYIPIKGPDGVMSTGSMVDGPKFKTKRGQIFTRRGADIIPGWGSIAGNLTMTNDFERDIELIMNQDNVEGVFWINENTNQLEATYFDTAKSD